MKFRASFSDPFRSDIIELGDIDPDTIIERFRSVSWTGYLERMESTGENELFYSPSFEVENKENSSGISISAVGTKEDFEFSIFYKRPREVRKFFGLSKAVTEDYITDITGQTEADAVSCLEALIRNDLGFLEQKVKS